MSRSPLGGGPDPDDGPSPREWENSEVGRHSLGSGQAVRQLILDQPIGGSNPPSPARRHSAAVRTRGSGEKTRNRIDAAMPAQPSAMAPRRPTCSATNAATRAPT